MAVVPTQQRAADPSVTFVTCIESGLLESQVLLLARSIRRFGGRFAGCPIIAVKARYGPPIGRDTRRHLRDLGVDYTAAGSRHAFGWYHFMNKPVALACAEKRATSETLVFLDGDTLVVGEPERLELGHDVDFSACAPDNGVVGTTGSSDPNDRYWDRICAINGLRVDQLPWVTPFVGGTPIRLYWNGGVIAYRRNVGFAQPYLDACVRGLKNHAGFPTDGEHWLEQVSIGIAMISAGLRWSALPHSHNYAVASYLAEDPVDALRNVRILHYHDSMGAHHWSRLLTRLNEAKPDVAEWLQAVGPPVDSSAVSSRAARELLRIFRGVPRRRYRYRVRRTRKSSQAFA